MEQLESFLFSGLAAPVVARGGRYIGMPCHFLHGANVGTRIEQVGDKGASEIKVRLRNA